MKAKSIFGILIFLCFSILCNSCVYAAQDTVYSWYCKRNNEHKQPTVDSSMQFIDQYGGYYVDKNHGDDSEDKVIYLTFDAGYENGNISKILDTLKAENVSGAFFILGHLINSHPELILRMVNEGHTVANHTKSHKDMTIPSDFEEFKAELEGLEALYLNVTGVNLSRYYRPPEGKFDERSLKYATDMGYKTIFWSLAYADWDNNNQMAQDKAMKKILDNIHNGAVILLHPTSETNAAILKDLITTLRSQGYRFGTLDELTK